MRRVSRANRSRFCSCAARSRSSKTPLPYTSTAVEGLIWGGRARFPGPFWNSGGLVALQKKSDGSPPEPFCRDAMVWPRSTTPAFAQMKNTPPFASTGGLPRSVGRAYFQRHEGRDPGWLHGDGRAPLIEVAGGWLADLQSASRSPCRCPNAIRASVGCC